MQHFSAKNLGQIKDAQIELGDFTVLVGPQASGKSILLQMMKLCVDGPGIRHAMKNHGVSDKGDLNMFLELYLGEGMGAIWNANTRIEVDQTLFDVSQLLQTEANELDKMAYIPAQRVLSLNKGWPRPYSDFGLFDPFVLKKFSDRLQIWLELGINNDEVVFPHAGLMNPAIEAKIRDSIFYNASVQLDERTPQRRLMLHTGKSKLAYLGWSAGQREFMPLLLQLHWLFANSQSRHKKQPHHKYVVIEEPEMGLHPKAIEALMLSFLELISRGYKVIVSTHSTDILELCWAVRFMQEMKAGPDELFKLFNLKKKTPALRSIFEHIIGEASFNTFYFERTGEGVVTRDISALDPGDEDEGMGEWGGLTSFASKASEIVSNLMAAKNDV